MVVVQSFSLLALNATIWRRVLLKGYAGTALLDTVLAEVGSAAHPGPGEGRKGGMRQAMLLPADLCPTACTQGESKDRARVNKESRSSEGPWWWGRAEAIQEAKPIDLAQQGNHHMSEAGPRLSTEQLPSKGLELPRELITNHPHTALSPGLIPGYSCATSEKPNSTRKGVGKATKDHEVH